MALNPKKLLEQLKAAEALDPSFGDRDLYADCPGVNRLITGVATDKLGDLVLQTKPDGAEPENPLIPLVEELAQALHEAQTLLNVQYDDLGRWKSAEDDERLELADKYRKK